MTKSSPELAAFAASLNAHPEDVEDMYQYCLAMVMVETGQAELTKIELRGREPWCTFKSITGDEFVVLRPVLSQTEEREMMETIWSIFHPNEGPLRVVRPALVASPNTVSETAPPPPPPPPVETRDWEGLVRRTPKRRRWKGELPRPARPKKPIPLPTEPTSAIPRTPLTVEGVDAITAGLRQLIEQAQIATETLRGMMEETRQVSEAAWEATRENRLVLAEIRTAIRQYERAHQENHAPSRLEQKRSQPEPPPRGNRAEDRNKELTLDVLGGMSMIEAGRKFGISPGRVKTIYMNQFYRLYHLKDMLDLSREDIAIIRGQEHPNLVTGQRPHADHIRELLEKMWELEKS